MAGTIIDASGGDTITLHYLEPQGIKTRKVRNKTWIFVSGSDYDLDFLASQIDGLGNVKFSYSTGQDVYGKFKGIRIYLNPSQIGDMLYALDNIGLGRKFYVYNADIDPAHRFVAESNLELFHIDSPDDLDPDVPTVSIEVMGKGRKPEKVRINSDGFMELHGKAYQEIYEAMHDAFIVVYDNRFDLFSSLLGNMRKQSMPVPYRILKGGAYQSYGQVHYNNNRVHLNGKIMVESSSFIYREAGLPGLMEMSRISSVPMSTVSVVTPGTAVSLLEVSHALRSGVLVPLYKSDHEGEKTVGELIQMDRGGLVLQPEPGIYEDVTEIDFSSMYPSIIVRYNLSPETVSRFTGDAIPDSPYRVSNDRQGFLSMALRNLLETRLYYKAIKSRGHVYSMRDTALKWMLLTSFGYTGYKNAKFGKIEVHESITAIGRHCLSRAMRIAESMGFSVVHGIVDSLWLRGNGNIPDLLRRIRDETRIDIVEEGHYKWIVFLPSRSRIGALNRYFGLKYDRTFKIRGIEMRRKDAPGMVVKFQSRALEILKRCNSVADICSSAGAIRKLESMFMRNIKSFPREDFVLRISPSMWKDQYRVRNIARIAMESFGRDMEISPGQQFPAVVVDRKNSIIDIDGSYDTFDAGFYMDLLKRSFEPFDYLVSEACGSGKSPYKSLYLFR